MVPSSKPTAVSHYPVPWSVEFQTPWSVLINAYTRRCTGSLWFHTRHLRDGFVHAWIKCSITVVSLVWLICYEISLKPLLNMQITLKRLVWEMHDWYLATAAMHPLHQMSKRSWRIIGFPIPCDRGYLSTNWRYWPCDVHLWDFMSNHVRGILACSHIADRFKTPQLARSGLYAGLPSFQDGVECCQILVVSVSPVLTYHSHDVLNKHPSAAPVVYSAGLALVMLVLSGPYRCWARCRGIQCHES